MDSAPPPQEARPPLEARQGQGEEDAFPRPETRFLGGKTATRMLMHAVDARQRGEIERAIPLFRDVVWACPGQAPPLWNLGEALMNSGQHAEAVEWFWRAARMVPEGPQAHFAWRNLGVCHWKMGRPTEALPFFRRALWANPKDQESRHDLAVISLAEGNYEEGWEQYLWRLVVQRTKRPISPLPDPFTKRVMLTPEQGLGDVLYFLRWVPALKALGVPEIHCMYPHKIASVLRRAFPEIIEDFGDEDCFDIRTGDLPFLTGAHEPQPAVPLYAKPRDPLPQMPPGPRIGVTWRAGTKQELGQWKETRPDRLADVVRAVGGCAVLLQRRSTLEERMLFRDIPHLDYTDACEDPEFVLDLLPHLDAYVCVSNTNVHLAAGLPKEQQPEMHVLVTHPPETRWMTRGSSSPWFPGMTCYRQDGLGRWPDNTFDLIRKALAR